MEKVKGAVMQKMEKVKGAVMQKMEKVKGAVMQKMEADIGSKETPQKRARATCLYISYYIIFYYIILYICPASNLQGKSATSSSSPQGERLAAHSACP